MDLKEKIKTLPSSPGVYLMKDSLDSIIYVGKSKNLKNRVSSYFHNSKAHSPKVVKLVKNIRDFEYKLTDTEFEAFMLECKLIKEIKPIYNKLMKSPLGYTYIKININEKYPQIQISNEDNKDDGNLYFGPYTSKNTVERAVQGIKECCKILCSNTSRKASACLNYSLGLCIGICLDTPYVNNSYHNIIDKIIKLLNGTDSSILLQMEEKMQTASEKFDFEVAAKYRDYISAVKTLLNKETVIEFTKENENIVLLEYLPDNIIKYFLINGNKVLFSEKYILNGSNLDELKTIIKNNILSYFNNEISVTSIEIGRDEIDEAQIIYSYLKNSSSSRKYIIIDESLINEENNTNIDSALDNFLNQ